LREARAAAKARHSNVASVLHLSRTGSSYFYAMEFVEGETLEHLIRRSGRVEVKLALEIVAQMAAGLAAVHEQNLVHRDIKPSNIMVRLKDDGGIASISVWRRRSLNRVTKPQFRRRRRDLVFEYFRNCPGFDTKNKNAVDTVDVRFRLASIC
jgi:serine/threonine protein kinase